MLEKSIMRELGMEMCQLMEDGHIGEIAWDIMKDKVRNEYDGDIWEIVDLDEDGEMDFDDILYEIMVEVSNYAEYYYENNRKGD